MSNEFSPMELMRRWTIIAGKDVKIKGRREWVIRVTVAMWLLRLAARIGGMGFDQEETGNE